MLPKHALYMDRRAMLVGLGVALAYHRAVRADEALRIGMIPDAGATQVSVEEKAPLRDYLANAIGRPVQLIIPTNYNATVEGLGNSSLDVAYLGALTYVKARQRYHVEPLVQRQIDRAFHSPFITQANSSIHKLSDLKGKSFAFGDINSTSGHLMAYQAMMAAGIDPDKDFTYRYTGSHAATVKAVESGAMDAGACDETVFKEMTTSGKADPAKLRIFFTSPPFVDYVWVARPDLDPKIQKSVTAAFLALKPEKDDTILKILRADTFVTANDAEYDPIRDAAKVFNLL